jgi:hypothetical protein
LRPATGSDVVTNRKTSENASSATLKISASRLACYGAGVKSAEAAILGRMFKPESDEFSPEVARSLLKLEFDAQDLARMHELAVRGQARMAQICCTFNHDPGSLASGGNEIAPFVGRNVMQRKLLGICGFLLFATFGMLSAVGRAHQDEPNAPSETFALQGDGLQRQDMSE